MADGEQAGTQVSSTDRLTASGRTMLKNKGKVVKHYGPWFSSIHVCDPETGLTEYGFTPVFRYDPLSRNIRPDFPDRTLTKVEFSPWLQKNFDQDDNVSGSDWDFSEAHREMPVTRTNAPPQLRPPKTTHPRCKELASLTDLNQGDSPNNLILPNPAANADLPLLTSPKRGSNKTRHFE